MRVIAALHQPLTILAANNLADVVSPDDDNCKFAGNSDPLRGIIASNSDPF